MDRAEILEAFDRVFDAALVFHAFTDYMRDYEILFAVSAAPSTGIPTEHLRYVFRLCVQAEIESTVERKVWRVSLDDALIDYESGVGRDGYVWGVKWQAMYPGARRSGGQVPCGPSDASLPAGVAPDAHDERAQPRSRRARRRQAR
jgi:hypothetical protein